MVRKKITAILLIFIMFFGSFSYINAEEIDKDTSSYIELLKLIIKRYEEKIRDLKIENAWLKDKVISLWWNIEEKTKIVSEEKTEEINNSNSNEVETNYTEEEHKYSKLIEYINSQSKEIFINNNLDPTSSIWLFEFIEPSNFFVSIDDFKNPSWLSAFKLKILYSYDENLKLKIVWIFEIDYNSWYYVTKYWKNPFATTKRIRVKNPSYKWKLIVDAMTIEEAEQLTKNNIANTVETEPKIEDNSADVVSSITTSTTPTKDIESNVTLDQIKNEYAKNNILSALRLSNEYIKTDPNNMDVLKIRYRSFYILWRFDEALSEIKKIENIYTTSWMEKIVVCDAKTIAKLAQDKVLYNKYSNLCSAR